MPPPRPQPILAFMRTEPNSAASDGFLVASDVQPPVVRGSPSAAQASRAHQERATALARLHAGRILVRVGQGCVAPVRRLEDALLLAARLVHPAEHGAGAASYPVRAAVHGAPVGDAPTPLAEPGVIRVRELLERAGPGEILISAELHAALPEPRPQASPLLRPRRAEGAATADEAAPLLPEAYRLLWRPALDRLPQDKPLRSGLLVGTAVLLVVLLAVLLVALGLLGR